MEAFGSLYLSPRLAELYQRHPSVRVELVTASHWVNLSKREADVLISFPKPRGHRITAEKIGEFSLFLYASQDYIARYGMPRTVDDLKDHRFIDYIDELVVIPAVRWLSDVLRDQETVFPFDQFGGAVQRGARRARHFHAADLRCRRRSTPRAHFARSDRRQTGLLAQRPR